MQTFFLYSILLLKFLKMFFATQILAKIECLIATNFAKSTVNVDGAKSEF